MIETTGDLITFALRAAGINGVGQTPLAEDSNTGLQLLANLIAEWQRKRWLVYTLEGTAVTSDRGRVLQHRRWRRLRHRAPRQAGSGLCADDSDRARPVDRLSPGADPGARRLRQDHAEDPHHLPRRGLLRFHLSPPASCTSGRSRRPGNSSSTSSPSRGCPATPPSFSRSTCRRNTSSAALYNLAVDLALNYGLDPRQGIVMRARATLQTLRMANVQPATLVDAGAASPAASGAPEASWSGRGWAPPSP